MSSFAVTWDYRCPFARNAHEHLVAALADGAEWDVSFLPFSLSQVHVPEGGTAVWDDPAKAPELSLWRREWWSATSTRIASSTRTSRCSRRGTTRVWTCGPLPWWPACSTAWASRATRSSPRSAPSAPAQEIRRAHEQAVRQLEVFGVPTFVVGDRAAFVRLMSRPQGDAALARRTIQGVLDLFDGQPDLNEFKHTSLSH